MLDDHCKDDEFCISFRPNKKILVSRPSVHHFWRAHQEKIYFHIIHMICGKFEIILVSKVSSRPCRKDKKLK